MTRIALAAGSLLLLGACTYSYPLTDADPAVTDDQLVGIWHIPDGGDSTSSDVMLLPLSSGRYLATIAQQDADEPLLKADAKPCERTLLAWGVAQVYYVAHVSDLDGARFLNLESVCGDAGYAFARYWINGDTLRLALVDDLEGDFGSTADIAAAVRSRLNDSRLYGDTVVAYRTARRTVSVSRPRTLP